MACYITILVMVFITLGVFVIIGGWKSAAFGKGNIDDFDGVTIARFDKNHQIYDLKEFQSKAEHYRPYGE